LSSPSRSSFRRHALASGLVTADQMYDAEDALRASAAAHPASAHGVDEDDRLAAQLVAMGQLNPWQVEQLKRGRSKFNLGPYQVIDSIGQGGMGQVFRAEHTMMGRTVAIKVLPRYKSTPVAIASFTREIRAQAQMDHENLVRAFDAGHDGNVYFLVTECVNGSDLRKFVRIRGRLSMTEAATIISQAATGLGHAHSRGLIHRDVKPGNLLVTTTGQTKVSDLGLAGFLGDDDEDDPRWGKVVGTADYLAPEQIVTPKDITPACDVYSLGCTLYYAVTGKVPFPGGTIREKARRHCEEAPLNPKRINPELSDEFVEVVAAMMDKNPLGRIQTMAEVVERLKPWATDAVAAPVGEPPSGATHFDPLESLPGPITDNSLSFLGDEPSGGSLSQISQRTDALSEAAQETMPDVERRRLSREEHDFPLSIVLAVLLPIILAAAVLVINLLLRLWR
jgi:serine/threonine protein kinase